MRLSVELREIEVFLTLVEELHFGRTAERLQINGSRVSQVINTFEVRIGGRLFERTSRRVRLTPLGVEVDARLRPAYEQLVAELHAATIHARTTARSLRLGVTVNTNRPSLARVIEMFQRAHPECLLDIIEVDTWDPYAALREDHIDVLCGWLAVEEPGLTVGPVIEQCARALVVGTQHRLAKRASVSVEEITGERVNRPPEHYPTALAEAILVPRTPSGQHIRRDNQARSAAEVASLIARGKLVSINVVGSSFFSRDDITVIPITDLPPLPLGLIWCTTRENVSVRALAQTVQASTRAAPRPRPGAGDAALAMIR